MISARTRQDVVAENFLGTIEISNGGLYSWMCRIWQGAARWKKSQSWQKRKISITKFVTDLISRWILLSLECIVKIQSIPIILWWYITMIILYPNLCSLPDVVETKKDQNWKILSRKNCFTAEIEAAVILRPPFRDKLQRKQTSKHCQWNNQPKNYVFSWY